MRQVTFHKPNRWGIPLMIAVVAFVCTILSAWVTHIVWIIGTLASPAGATVGQMVLGVLGAFVPPFGIVHGFMIWLGMGF